MLRTPSYRRPMLLAVLFLPWIGPAWSFAGSLPLTLLGESAGADVTITYSNPSAPAPDYPNGFTLTGFAGSMNLQLGDNQPFLGFCVDLAHFVSPGQTFLVNAYSTNSPANGLTNGPQVAYLANTYGPYLTNRYSQPTLDIQGAGLQIAIWSELYDNGQGFTSGKFQYTASANANDPSYSAIAAAATTYLAEAQNQSANSTWYDGSPSGNGQWRGQSMVLADPPPAVPEPPAFALFSLGAIALGIASWWVRRYPLAAIHASIPLRRYGRSQLCSF